MFYNIMSTPVIGIRNKRFSANSTNLLHIKSLVKRSLIFTACYGIIFVVNFHKALIKALHQVISTRFKEVNSAKFSHFKSNEYYMNPS